MLAAALVADLTVKKDRSLEWDRQIAVVEAEAAQLRERQAESWCRIQQRSVARGLLQQRRTITTSAACAFEVSDEMDPLASEKELNAGDLESTDGETDLATTEEHVEMQKRFERLVATRLALQFMLQLRAGRSNLYTPQVSIGPSNPKYSQSMDYLVRELEKVQHMMAAMRIETVPWRLEMPLDFIERKKELGNRLDELTESYRRVEMHLPDFIMSYVQLIGEYKMGPPVPSYIFMMRTLSNMQNGESPMAAMTENAVWDTHQLLSSHAIANIVYRHGSDGESIRFKELLSIMSDSTKWPKPYSSWFRATVNEMQISIPESRNPALMTALIRTALCNEQQTIAEAYATVFFTRARVSNYHGHHKWHVVACFLESYGSWGTWTAAKRWLQTAVQWAMDLLDAGEDILGRVVLRMLNCCVACNQRDEYEQILEAAVTHNIKCPRLDDARVLKLSDRTRHIRHDWLARTRARRKPHEPLKRMVTMQDVAAFQEALQGRFDDQQNLPTKKPFHPSETKWRGDKKLSTAHRPMLTAAQVPETNTQPKTNDTHPVPAGDVTDESFQEKDPSMLTISPFFSTAAEEQYLTQDQSVTSRNTLEQQHEIERLRKALAEAEAKLRAAERQEPLQEQPEQAEVYVAEELTKQAGTG